MDHGLKKSKHKMQVTLEHLWGGEGLGTSTFCTVENSPPYTWFFHVRFCICGFN